MKIIYGCWVLVIRPICKLEQCSRGSVDDWQCCCYLLQYKAAAKIRRKVLVEISDYSQMNVLKAGLLVRCCFSEFHYERLTIESLNFDQYVGKSQEESSIK